MLFDWEKSLTVTIIFTCLYSRQIIISSFSVAISYNRKGLKKGTLDLKEQKVFFFLHISLTKF